MSVESVLAVVNTKTLKDELLHRSSLLGGVLKRVEKKKSVAGQFAVKYKSEAYRWTKKLNKEYYGIDKYGVIPVVKE